MDFYSKMGGLNKYWDGYDNQPIVVIDDPGLFNIQHNEDCVIAFKNVVSNGAFQVEVKYGSLQFDSYLVIIISNIAPGILAMSGGSHADSLYSRFVGNRSIVGRDIVCNTPEDARVTLISVLEQCCTNIANRVGTGFDCSRVRNVMNPIVPCQIKLQF